MRTVLRAPSGPEGVPELGRRCGCRGQGDDRPVAAAKAAAPRTAPGAPPARGSSGAWPCRGPAAAACRSRFHRRFSDWKTDLGDSDLGPLSRRSPCPPLHSGAGAAGQDTACGGPQCSRVCTFRPPSPRSRGVPHGTNQNQSQSQNQNRRLRKAERLSGTLASDRSQPTCFPFSRPQRPWQVEGPCAVPSTVPGLRDKPRPQAAVCRRGWAPDGCLLPRPCSGAALGTGTGHLLQAEGWWNASFRHEDLLRDEEHQRDHPQILRS